MANEKEKITIDLDRYEHLVATEALYILLENAIVRHKNYSDLSALKRCFGIYDRELAEKGENK